MDPNSIIKLVRLQRRQINDSLNSNHNNNSTNINNTEIIMDRKNSSSASSTSSSSSALSYESEKQDISQFLIPASAFNNNNHTSSNYSIPITRHTAFNHISEDTQASRKSFDFYDSKSSSRFYDYSCEANLIKYRSDLSNSSLIDEHHLKLKHDSEDLAFGLRAKIKKRNSSSNELNISNNNNNNNNSSQIYHQQQQQHHEQSLSRCASVKSVASDSGVGSTSPLSDCSDLGSSNNSNSLSTNTKSAFTKTYLIQKQNLKQQTMEMNSIEKMNDSFSMTNSSNQMVARKRKSEYDDDDVFLSRNDKSAYANNHIYLKQHSEPVIINNNNNNNDRNLVPYQNLKHINTLQNNNNFLQQQNNQLKNLPYQMNFNPQPAEKCTKECCAHLNSPGLNLPTHLLPNRSGVPEQMLNRHPINSFQSGVPVPQNNKPFSLCDCNECKAIYFNQYLKSVNQQQQQNEKKPICNCADPNCTFNKNIYLNNQQLKPQDVMLNGYNSNKISNGRKMLVNQQQCYPPPPPPIPMPNTPHLPSHLIHPNSLQQQQQQQQNLLCNCADCFKSKQSSEIYKYKLAEQALMSSAASPTPLHLRPSSAYDNYASKHRKEQLNSKYVPNYDIISKPNFVYNSQSVNQFLDDDYADLIKKGIQITKQKNRFYENENNSSNSTNNNNNDRIYLINDSQRFNHNLPSVKTVDTYYKDIQINNSNMNLITQAKNTHPAAAKTKPPTETDNIKAVPTAKGTSIVCLSADETNDFELGEVVQMDKLKNATNVEILHNESLLKTSDTPTDRDIPVTVSKKMLPIVMPKILDWLDKCVEFTFRIKSRTKINFNSIMDLLNKAWPRLLLVYMIENSFDFCVTKDINHQTNNSNSESSTDLNNNSQSVNELPREKDANQLHSIISKGYGFNLNSQEFDLLRELILFREGGEEPLFYSIFLDSQKSLQEAVEVNHGKLQFSKLLLFLPSIYNIKTEIIDKLFCRHLKNFKSVYEFLDSRLRAITCEQNSSC